MAFVQKDVLLIRTALVPVVILIIHKPAIKVLNLTNLTKWEEEEKKKTSRKDDFGLKALPIFPEATAKALRSNFGNDKTFFLCTSCSTNPPLVYFLKMERAIPPQGQSQAATRLIVLLNRSIITIRLRLLTETNYSKKNARLKERNPDAKPWPPHWESFISSNRHLDALVWVTLGVNQSNDFWLLVMADTEAAKKCFYSLFMLLLRRSVTDSSDSIRSLRTVQGKQLMEELACLALLRSSSQPLL